MAGVGRRGARAEWVLMTSVNGSSLPIISHLLSPTPEKLLDLCKHPGSSNP